MKELMEDYQLAKQGRTWWLEIKKEYGIDEFWYVVICPEKDGELNRLLLEHLPDFLERKFIYRAFILVEEGKQRNDDGYQPRHPRHLGRVQPAGILQSSGRDKIQRPAPLPWSTGAV